MGRTGRDIPVDLSVDPSSHHDRRNGGVSITRRYTAAVEGTEFSTLGDFINGTPHGFDAKRANDPPAVRLLQLLLD